MNMCSIWISHTIIVLSLFNADLVIGQINNVLSGARFNITLKFIPNENAILWIRETANLRDASVNTTTGSDCGNPFIPTPAGLNFYCEDSGGTYILELDGSDSDQGIVYTSDPPPSQSFEYAVIDKDHTAAINYTRIPENFTLTEPITLSCTVTCTLQDTSITVYVKQNDTTLHQLNSASNTVNCSSVGFQTITESSDLTLDAVRSLNITEPFNIVFNISHRGRFLTRKTATIIVSSDPTTAPIETTTVAQSSISQTSTTGATTSSDVSSSTPLSSSSLPSTSQQDVTNGAGTAPNTPPPKGLSNEILAVIIASSVVGIIIFVATICLIVCCVVIRKRKRNPRKAQHSGNHSYSNMGYNYNGRPDTYPSESKHHSRHTPRQRPDYLRGPAVSGSPYGHYLDNQFYSNPYRNYPDYQLYNYQYKNYPSKSEYNHSSRNKSSAPNHTASSRHDPRSDKYFDRNRDFNQEYKQSSRNKSSAPKQTTSPRHGPRSEKYQDPNRNYNYVDQNRDFKQEYYIRPYAGGYPLRSGDYRYYR